MEEENLDLLEMYVEDLIVEDNTIKGVKIKEAKYLEDEEHNFVL